MANRESRRTNQRSMADLSNLSKIRPSRPSRTTRFASPPSSAEAKLAHFARRMEYQVLNVQDKKSLEKEAVGDILNKIRSEVIEFKQDAWKFDRVYY
mmetsp:Transcript_9728/g.23932  ORF Transcript_9728/g.23932 Transcript_9728/m.23932 type:complete len:97 (-) Transcript_9728:158-448(-)